MSSSAAITGYAEGYYGRLLSWDQRARLLDTLRETGGNFYLYAPKDDDYHRFNWRTPYPDDWRENFRTFATKAKTHDKKIQIVAGLSPGIDFDFSQIDNGRDYQLLCDKAQQLLSDGACAIALMFDDIDADFEQRCGAFDDEGMAHAELANRLYYSIKNFQHKTIDSDNQEQHTRKLCYAVPRIYANELVDGSDSSLISDGLQHRNRRYLHTFLDKLDTDIDWFYCGNEIIAKEPSADNLKNLLQSDATHLFATLDKKSETTSRLPASPNRIVIWDNYYANDYCPRRLFLGPWVGRERCVNIVINPTGLVHTDQLLIRIVAACRDPALSDIERHDKWYQCLVEAQVPEAFQRIKHYFNAPTFSDNKDNEESNQTIPDTKSVSENKRQTELDALEQLLWRWKSPLAREWYPYLLGLKHDLQLEANDMSELRIQKTQTSPLASRLTNSN